ncbi:MAG: hypothetical protein ACR2RB_03480 [Gammaproteobacteria bacterium]
MANTSAPKGHTPPSAGTKIVLLGFIVVWSALQIVVPLRHLLYPGSPSWTEEGHRFAWQMKLRDKKGWAKFHVRDPASGQEWEVSPRTFLVRHQARKVVTRPDMILQFAHHLARVWEEERHIKGVEIRAEVCVSLNGRPGAVLIDPNRDLARVKRSLRHADWILPLEQPFERPPDKRRRRDIRC